MLSLSGNGYYHPIKEDVGYPAKGSHLSHTHLPHLSVGVSSQVPLPLCQRKLLSSGPEILQTVKFGPPGYISLKREAKAMALVERAPVLLMVMAAVLVEVSYGAVYKVGDSAGWTTLGNIDYRKWAAPKNFQIGDTIIFEYNAQFHNVMRVTHAMYKTCNTSSPIATFTTGNDSIKLTNYGHHFFFCGVPGHCQAGQKVDINVIKVSAAAPAPSSALASPAVSGGNNVPAPSPSNAAPLNTLKGAFGIIVGLALVVLALAIPSYA